MSYRHEKVNNTDMQAAKKWFSKVNKTLNELSIPYCSISIAKAEGQNLFSYECVKHLTDLPLTEKDYIVRYLQNLEDSKPDPDIFLEIKNGIARSAIYEITDIYPCARSAIVFGDPFGDIDLGLIIEKEDRREIRVDEEYTMLLRKLRQKYPLIDIFALSRFRSISGKELAENLFAAHCAFYVEDGVYPLQQAALPHMNRAFENSWLLYGDIDDRRDFMEIYRKIIAPLRQLKTLNEVNVVSVPIYDIIVNVVSKFARIKT